MPAISAVLVAGRCSACVGAPDLQRLPFFTRPTTRTLWLWLEAPAFVRPTPVPMSTPTPTPTITLRCHGELNDFLPCAQRGRPITLPWAEHETVKQVVEAAGVPHPEIAALLVDGEPVDFTHRLAAGDVIDAYPHTLTDHLPARRLRPSLSALRFVCDVHLGRLAAYLRMLGFDTWYSSDQDDSALAAIAGEEGRVLLTRDRGLLKRSAVIYGAFVRATSPEAQLREVAERFALRPAATPFRRCLRCNGLTEPVAKEEILERLAPKTQRYYDEFWRCVSCGQIYCTGAAPMSSRCRR